MGDLADWAKKNSPYLKIGLNETVKVVYLGFKEVEDTRNPGKTKLRYLMEWEKQEKWFESAAAAVAMKLDGVAEGDIVLIKKTLVGNKNHYEVMLPGEEKLVSDEEA